MRTFSIVYLPLEKSQNEIFSGSGSHAYTGVDNKKNIERWRDSFFATSSFKFMATRT